MKLVFQKLSPTDIFSLVAVVVSIAAFANRVDQQHREILTENNRALYGSYTLGIDYRLLWEDFQGSVNEQSQQKLEKRLKTLQPIALNVGITLPSDAFSMDDIREDQKNNGSPEAVVSDALQTRYDDSNELNAFLLGESLQLLSWHYDKNPSEFMTNYDGLKNEANVALNWLLQHHGGVDCRILPDVLSSPSEGYQSVRNLRICLHNEWLGERPSYITSSPAPQVKSSSRLSFRDRLPSM